MSTVSVVWFFYFLLTNRRNFRVRNKCSCGFEKFYKLYVLNCCFFLIWPVRMDKYNIALTLALVFFPEIFSSTLLRCLINYFSTVNHKTLGKSLLTKSSNSLVDGHEMLFFKIIHCNSQQHVYPCSSGSHT